ncbi:MAG: hypothetical protein HY841_04725 [Bacteroidetes bacterium]|nr:hypothetical protein [Bacteroidota bacterium]
MKKEEIKGGVIIIGSLFWEDEKNCMKGEKAKGKRRKKWRNDNLNIDKTKPIPLPVSYGRCSSSRLCTYTMVLSSAYNNKVGQGLVVPFKKEIDFSQENILKEQVGNLALAEGIYKKGETKNSFARGEQ